MLVTAIHRAERRVDLATPYFIPPQALLGALQSASARGVEVRLLLPEKTDNFVVDHAMKLWVGLVLERDISVRTVSPRDPSGGTQAARTFVHEKYAVIDGHVAIMGSSNLDQRSAFLNFEADIVAYGGGLPGDLAAHFERRWKDAKSYKIPLWLMPRSVRPDVEDLPDWIERVRARSSDQGNGVAVFGASRRPDESASLT
jgi:phosphatidylserine/phosphatidylglycerophosphate/cardiolipin synthase-like enzyme